MKNLVQSQAAQAPAVRWTSCAMRVMANIWEFEWEYRFWMGRQLLGITKYDKLSIKIPHLTFTVHCLFCDRLLSSNEAILAIIPFLGLLVVNLEMDIFRYDSYYAKCSSHNFLLCTDKIREFIWRQLRLVPNIAWSFNPSRPKGGRRGGGGEREYQHLISPCYFTYRIKH